MPGLRLLVAGGRNFADAATLHAILSSIHHSRGIALIIHGGAPGADTLAGIWAAENAIPVACYRAEWTKHGHFAGPIRNGRMLREAKPDAVLAFPQASGRYGPGTTDMIRQATRASVPVWEPGDMP